MSIRLIRESSDTPNISNRDDAYMIRYAYGGYAGIVKNLGEEVSLELLQDNQIRVGSGRVVFQGWEISIEPEVFDVTDTPDSTTLYFDHLYIEINLLLEEANFRLIRSSSEVAPLPPGDDLTQNTSGTARIRIGHWGVSGGIVLEHYKDIQVIEYVKTRIDLIEQRLSELGFKEGYIELTSPFNSVSPTKNIVSLKGTYVIGSLEFGANAPEISISLPSGSIVTYKQIKIGKISSSKAENIPRLFPKIESDNILNGVRVGIYCSLYQNTRYGLVGLSTLVDGDGDIYLTLSTGLSGASGILTVYGLYFGYEGAR